jgi:hypothetical protein
MTGSALPAVFTQLQQQTTNQAALLKQRDDVQGHAIALQSRLADLHKVADTYDREFLDRTRSTGGIPTQPSFFARKGLATFQDWLLATFFGVYALVTIVLLIYIVRISKTKGQAAGIVLASSIVIGIIMGALIRQFA